MFSVEVQYTTPVSGMGDISLMQTCAAWHWVVRDEEGDIVKEGGNMTRKAAERQAKWTVERLEKKHAKKARKAHKA